MPRRVCIVSLAASVLVGVVGAYLISLWPWIPAGKWPSARRVEYGVASVPSNPKELLGRYFRTDSTSAVYLTLLSNGTYLAEWRADIGDAGQATGNWSLHPTQLHLSPFKETDMMKGTLRAFDVYRFKSNWVFVAEGDRESYKKYGLFDPPLNHFQKDDTR